MGPEQFSKVYNEMMNNKRIKELKFSSNISDHLCFPITFYMITGGKVIDKIIFLSGTN